MVVLTFASVMEFSAPGAFLWLRSWRVRWLNSVLMVVNINAVGDRPVEGSFTSAYYSEESSLFVDLT